MSTHKPSRFRVPQMGINQILILLLSLGVLFLGYQNWSLKNNSKTNITFSDATTRSSETIPHYKEVMDIIRPLEYSGIAGITKGNVSLSIDFAKGTWALRNLHKYTSDGNIILEGHRYGLCGELASYTYNRIKPLFGDKYAIKFSKVSESGFFLAPRATHIVLLIYEIETHKTFLLDPSLTRYGNIDDFDQYLFFEMTDFIYGIKDRDPDVEFPIDHGTPLIIRNNLITNLGVASNDGKFDKDNFVIYIKANRKFMYTGRFVFAIRKTDGKTEAFEDKWLVNQALTSDEIERLKKVMLTWFEQIQ